MNDQLHSEAPSAKRARWVPWIALVLVAAAGVAVYSTIAGVRSQLGALAKTFDGRNPPARATVREPLQLAAPPLADAGIVEPTIPMPVAEPPRQPAAPEPLDEEHRPADHAVQTFIGDGAAFRSRLESLLAADPATLEQVRALLDEQDPNVLADNMRLLRDTFAVE